MGRRRIPWVYLPVLVFIGVAIAIPARLHTGARHHELLMAVRTASIWLGVLYTILVFTIRVIRGWRACEQPRGFDVVMGPPDKTS
jgi:hypothetical protein